MQALQGPRCCLDWLTPNLGIPLIGEPFRKAPFPRIAVKS
jgi:hypothetical protein